MFIIFELLCPNYQRSYFIAHSLPFRSVKFCIHSKFITHIWLNTNETSWPLTVQNRWKHSTQPPMTHSPMPHSLMTPFSQCPIWSMPPIHQWPPFSNNSFTNDPIQPMLPFTNDPIQPVTTIHQCPILNDPFIKSPFMKDSSSQWREFTNASFSKKPLISQMTPLKQWSKFKQWSYSPRPHSPMTHL